MNTIRKIAINNIKLYKQETKSKLPLSKIMFGCLLDCEKLIEVFIVGGLISVGDGAGLLTFSKVHSILK